MDQPDKLTETRGSLEVQNTFIKKIYRYFCPCIVSSTYNDKNTQVFFDSEVSNRSDSTQYRKQQLQMPKQTNFPHYNSFATSHDNENQFKMMQYQRPGQQKKIKSKTFLINSTIQRKNNCLINDLKNMENTKTKQWHNYSVYRFKENQLIIIGKSSRHILVNISTIHLQPSPCAVKKQYASKPSQRSQNYYHKILDDFWNKRYFCFEKFDEGIQIDEGSMARIPPEIVSEHIAEKCGQCKTALDAFSGIGSNALKLGGVCEKVICVEQDCKRYKYLINNAKVYEVQNVQLFLKPFVQIQLKNSVDMVFAQPYFKNQEALESSSCNIDDFEPPLDKIIIKSLEISQNLILLLPPNVNIQRVCEVLSESCNDMNKVFSTCSIKVQKIFFKQVLTYLAIYFGPKVQKIIKLNDQLNLMYNALKNKYQKNFQHKKLLKKLRQTYGMVKLLNFIYQSKKSQGKTDIDKLYAFVRSEKLLTQAKIQKIISEQNKLKERKNSRMKSYNTQFIDQGTNRQSVTDMYESSQTGENSRQKSSKKQQEEQNVQDRTQSQRTQSYYSNYSGFSNMKKAYTQSFAESKKESSKGDRSSNVSSIIIKREDGSLQKQIRFEASSLQKSSKSPASPNLLPINHPKPVRGSLNLDIKRIQQEMKYTNRQQLKKSLISKI